MARMVLRNRYVFLGVFLGITVLLAMQWKYIRMTYSEANMLPKDSPISKEYDKFLSIFGEEGNLIVIGVEADKITKAGGFNRWNMLAHDLQKFPQVESCTRIQFMSASQRVTSFLRRWLLKGNWTAFSLNCLTKRLYMRDFCITRIIRPCVWLFPCARILSILLYVRILSSRI